MSDLQIKYPDLLQPPKEHTYKKRLTYEELLMVENILQDTEKFDHIRHTLSNLVRIPYQFLAYKNFSVVKATQFGLNLGRAQELLNSVGGLEYWWRTFKTPIENSDWKLLLDISKDRFIEIMGALDLLEVNELDRL